MKTNIYQNFTIHHFKNLNSTNITAKEMSLTNEIQENTIIIADSQNNGKGRLNRDWTSKEGNLFFSILLKPTKTPQEIPQISFIAAISLQNTIKNLILASKSPKTDVKNKWPNDILVNNKKIAGILLESEINARKCDFCILGIGVNLISCPKNVMFEATDLSQFEINIEKEQFLHNFLDNFNIFYQKWLNFGFLPIKNEWLANSWHLNQEISIDSGKIKGIFKEIDNNGAIIIENEQGRVKVEVGDVS